MSSEGTIFVGRKAELARWDEILRDPAGRAAVVIGPPGMGKTALLDKIMSLALIHPDLACGAVRYEVTRSDTADVVMELMMMNAFEAATVEPGSLDMTERRVSQWNALLGLMKFVPGGEQLRDLAASLQHNPTKPLREQLIARLAMVSERLPENGRAVFVIDPEKYMATGSANAWRLIVRDLPDRIKLVFAQRPQDAIAEGYPNSEFWQTPGVALLTESSALEPLEPDAVDDYADASQGTGLKPSERRTVLARYSGHPFAMDAAVRLLCDGTPADDLPDRAEPTVFAARQWDVLAKDYGASAIALIEALAVLEVAAPRDLVRTVANLEGTQLTALLKEPFVRGLVRVESGGLRLYHALFNDFVRQLLDKDPDLRDPYHRRAIASTRDRLKLQPPDTFAATRLWHHVRIVDGLEPAIYAFVNACTPILVQRGELAIAEADGRTLLDWLPKQRHGTEWESALRGNLGIVLGIRGDLDGAETMFRKSLEINKSLGHLKGMADQYGNLGNVLQYRGDLDDAETMYLKALELNESLGRPDGMAMQYGNLGNVFHTRGNLDGAETVLRKALELNEYLERPDGMADTYGNLGNVLRARGDLDGAEAMLRKSLAINEHLGRPEGMANQYGNLGFVFQARGDRDGAKAMYRKALSLFRVVGAARMVEKTQRLLDALEDE